MDKLLTISRRQCSLALSASVLGLWLFLKAVMQGTRIILGVSVSKPVLTAARLGTSACSGDELTSIFLSCRHYCAIVLLH